MEDVVSRWIGIRIGTGAADGGAGGGAAGVEPSTLYALCGSGKLPHYRHGLGRGTIRLSEAQLAAYLASVESSGGGAASASPSPAPPPPRRVLFTVPGSPDPSLWGGG